MHINLLSGLLDGGAANAAKQLLRGLKKQGVSCRLYYPPKLKVSSSPPEDAYPAKWRNRRGWGGVGDYVRFRIHRTDFKKKVRGRPKGNEIFTSPRGAPQTLWPPSNHSHAADDILHLHWVAKFIDYPTFFGSLPPELPVVWTLHDMNPFTGGCHFADHCERFRNGCGDCPQLPQSAPNDISSQIFETKRNALSGVNLHVVAASRWMLEKAKSSPIFGAAKSFQRIPYGLRLDDYTPIPQAQARAELGLDPNAFIFSFGAVDIENRRKGMCLLLDGLQKVADLENVQGLVMGGGDLPNIDTPLPKLKSMGFVREVEKRVQIYSACDVFVLPSTEDNMPLTGLEALASGTAVVGFDAGGVPDFVRPDQTGLLAECFDAAGLGEQIRRLHDHRDEAARMGRVARQVIEDEYADTREATDYTHLYQRLLSESGNQ